MPRGCFFFSFLFLFYFFGEVELDEEMKREKRDLFRLESASRLFLSCIGIVSICVCVGQV